jgi:hypothetical protein
MVVWWYSVTEVTVLFTTIYILTDFSPMIFGKAITFVTTTNNHGGAGDQLGAAIAPGFRVPWLWYHELLYVGPAALGSVSAR